MMILRDLFLALALSQADGLARGGGEADELRAQAPLRGAARDPEGLEDLRRRVPPSTLQEAEKQEPPPAPAPRNAAPEETPSLDFSWLELYPRVGLAAFSSKYHVNPSACFGVAARAPMPWLSPSSNPHGEYFGLFAELDVSVIKRTIFPKLDKPSGPIFMIGFGVDYTIYRSESWLLMVEGGVHYVNFGGITDLTNGLTPMFGAIAGISVSRGMSLTLSPEIEYPKTGDYIMMLTLGLVWEF